MERLQRQLFEAIRQSNQVKVVAIKKQLDFYSISRGSSIHLPMPPPKADLVGNSEDTAPRFDM